MVLLPLASRTRPPPDITIFFKSYKLLVWFLQPMHSVAVKRAARRNKDVRVLFFIAVKFLRIQRFSRRSALGWSAPFPVAAIRRGRRCGNRNAPWQNRIAAPEDGALRAKIFLFQARLV